MRKIVFHRFFLTVNVRSRYNWGMKKINTQGLQIYTFQRNENDYISLTDIAKYKNSEDPRYVVQNWMKTRFTVDFLGAWERINNESFIRVEFDTFKNEAGSNAFVLTPQKWIEKTGAVGIISKSGRYGGGTFAHKDIAFEFATWISPEFKLYLIKEFQRLKVEENERLTLGWDAKRMLTEYFRAGLPQGERLLKLNESAIHQMRSLLGNPSVKKLGN